MNCVPRDVIEAFAGEGRPKKLLGGEGNSWIVGNTVFKPVKNVERYEWASELLLRIAKVGFRVSLPKRSLLGKFTFQGWAAAKFEIGEHINGRWNEKLRVCRIFSEALSDISVPPMPPSDDRWSRAHEIAWQEASLPATIPCEIVKKLGKLFERYLPIEPTNQVIHSDLCGNILFADNFSPLVIDFSPAYRPKEYAEAILVADAIAWESAPVELKQKLPETPYYSQMLLRAVNFRLIVAALYFYNDVDAFNREYDDFRLLLEVFLA